MWLDRLQDRGAIEDEATALAELAERRKPTGPAE
jgi:hypothetical protein